MNLFPCPAQVFQVFSKHQYNAGDISSGESIILPKLYRASRTVQIKNSLATMPDYMNVSRTMIVWIYHNTKAGESQNSRHLFILHYS